MNPVSVGDDLVERLHRHLAEYDADLQATIAAGVLPDRAAYGEDVSGVTYTTISEAAARIIAVEAERDAALDRALVWEHNWQQEVAVKGEVIGWCKDYQTKLTSTEARIAVLEKALSTVVEDFDQRMMLGEKTDIAETEAVNFARAALTPEPS